MIEKIEGIVVNERAYGETRKIINLVTKEYGLISLIAKGAKSLKSDLRTSTTKLTYGYFHTNYKENKLSTLISVDIIDNFKNIKKDINKISYATFILDLTEQVIKQNNDSNILKICIDALEKINEDYDSMIITNILELKYLDYLGVMPIIDSCAICGNKAGIATLSSETGGYVCKNCITNQVIVNEKTIKIIRMFYYVDISKLSNLEISNEVKKEINNFIDDYYDRYTGLYLKSKSFLKNLHKVIK